MQLKPGKDYFNPPPMKPKRCKEHGLEFRIQYMGTEKFLCGLGKEVPCNFQGKEHVNGFGETVYPCTGMVPPVNGAAARSGNPLGLERHLSPDVLRPDVEGVLNGTASARPRLGNSSAYSSDM